MGWEGNVFFPLLIVPGKGPPGAGIYVYTPTVALNNLVDSIAAANGTDSPGNNVLQGIVNYLPGGPNSRAVQLATGFVNFYTAVASSGPWTEMATLGVTSIDAADLQLTVFGTGIFIVNSPQSITASLAAGSVLAVTDTAANTGSLILATVAGASDRIFGGRQSGDTNNRIGFSLDASSNGQLLAGPGNAAPDCFIKRAAANTWASVGADFSVDTVGRGFQTKEGTNAKQGTATLVAGTVTVANTAVTANSRIFLTAQNSGAAPGALRVSARTAGTSFTITSTSATDTSLVAYELFEPAP